MSTIKNAKKPIIKTVRSITDWISKTLLIMLYKDTVYMKHINNNERHDQKHQVPLTIGLSAIINMKVVR